MQRNTIKGQPRTTKFRTWQVQFKEWEIDNFMKAMTWFSVRDVREIKPLPLPRLRKLNDNYSAPGFLDSGLTVFASMLPRPATKFAPERGFDSGTHARCTSA